MKPLSTILVLLVFLFALSACSLQAEPLPSGTWNLVSLNGSPVVEGTRVTLELNNEQVSGNSGCNSFGGTLKQNGKLLQFTDIAMTLMACMSEGVMEQESAYLASLQVVNSFELNDDTLTLRGPEVELVFSR